MAEPVTGSHLCHHLLGCRFSKLEIHTLIYTTNPIESVQRQIKIVAKNKSSFPNEQALIKLAYLAMEGASRKWTMRHRDWSMIYMQLMIFIEDRLAKYVYG
jgi:putative transposase